MAKEQKAAAEQNLPKLGCDECSNDIGLVGYVVVNKPGQPREVHLCDCRLKREQAKKALVSA